MTSAIRLKLWAEFLSNIRSFLDSRGYTEVTTDALVPAGAFEGTLAPIEAAHSGGKFELHTSPEIEMKCLLADSAISMYQICKCYRDDPTETGIHLKEFTMLEFYKVHCDYRALKKEVYELFCAVAKKQLPIREITIADAIREWAGVDLAGLRAQSGETFEDTFYKLIVEKLEPNLPKDQLVLVTDYPKQAAALADVNEDGWAERFEIYWQGMELCNGCTELQDLGELESRIYKEKEARKQLGKSAHPFPDRLYDAMKKGLPRCAGVAIGLDRLFWALHGKPV